MDFRKYFVVMTTRNKRRIVAEGRDGARGKRAPWEYFAMRGNTGVEDDSPLMKPSRTREKNIPFCSVHQFLIKTSRTRVSSPTIKRHQRLGRDETRLNKEIGDLSHPLCPPPLRVSFRFAGRRISTRSLALWMEKKRKKKKMNGKDIERKFHHRYASPSRLNRDVRIERGLLEEEEEERPLENRFQLIFPTIN